MKESTEQYKKRILFVIRVLHNLLEGKLHYATVLYLYADGANVCWSKKKLIHLAKQLLKEALKYYSLDTVKAMFRNEELKGFTS